MTFTNGMLRQNGGLFVFGTLGRLRHGYRLVLMTMCFRVPLECIWLSQSVSLIAFSLRYLHVM